MVAAGAERVKTWSSTKAWGSAGWQRYLAAVVAVVVFWPQASVDAAVGLHPSWQAGLAMARNRHIAWGPDVVFTHGPLGFLQTSAYYSYWQSVLATLYQVAVIAALFLGIAAALRQRCSAMTALIGAFVTTGVVGILLGPSYPEWVFFAAFVWASVPLLRHEPKWSTVISTCTLLAAGAGFQLLVKISTGLAIFAIALGVSVLLDWRAIWRHCATLTAFAASIPIWWMLAGQRLGDLPTWLKHSTEIASGYLDGMASSARPPDVFLANLVTLAWMVALGLMFVRGRPAIPRRFVLLAGLTTAFVGRATFGHLDLWHFCVLLATIVVVMAITPLPRARRIYLVAGVAITLIVVELAGTVIATRAVAMVETPGRVADRLVTLVVPGRHGQRVEQAKTRQRELYAIPDRFIATIGSAPVHIDPQETSAAWAYNLTWRPTPVFQTYMAWTPPLDGLNSQLLANGPKFVLSRISSASPATGIDGRLGVQESPLYSRALLCDYKLSGIENRWALFTHTTPHCGPLTPLSQVSIREHDTVNIPPPSGPDTAILVGIDLDHSIKERLLQETFAVATIPAIALDGVTYRLVARNAEEPFLVMAPASVAGTNLQIRAHNIGIGRRNSLDTTLRTARLRFYEMRVNP
jgi:hypothetical protein